MSERRKFGGECGEEAQPGKGAEDYVGIPD